MLFKKILPALFAVVLLLCLSLVQGTTYIVADVDGSVESYEALTTIAASSYASNLYLVTVNGATWGYSAPVVRNMCRFLQAAGLTSVTVGLGLYTSTDDQYSSTTYHGECQDNQGFPANPHDATQRGMAFSKADASNVFGTAVSLPLRTSTTTTCTFAAAASATEGLLKVLRLMSSSDRLIYYQLGTSATTLSQLLSSVSSQSDATDLTTKLQQQTDVHVLESGYAGAADTVAMKAVLASSLNVSLYAPAFYKSATLFSDAHWSTFQTLATRTTASTTLQWLLKAYTAKKAAMGSTFATTANAGASLMVLCVLRPSTVPCYPYRTSASSIGFQLNTPVVASGSSSLTMSGENVTVASYYVYKSNSSGSRYVYATSASTTVSGTTLDSLFWSAWFTLFGL